MIWLSMGQVLGVLVISSYRWIRIRVDQYVAVADMSYDMFAIILFYAYLYSALPPFSTVAGIVMVLKVIIEDKFYSKI